DEGINVRPTPLYDFDPADPFSGHTFHVDARYELAFRQKYELAESILKAVAHNRRVVVEHFDLIYEALGHNAQSDDVGQAPIEAGEPNAASGHHAFSGRAGRTVRRAASRRPKRARNPSSRSILEPS
ncbi:MAG TPA: hypothetical protein VLN41_01145, partial [Candidatus Bathyarchaeia archaeon]|nr:hypothetical protein [Candidatus Bathyarchaeia archaeon]